MKITDIMRQQGMTILPKNSYEVKQDKINVGIKKIADMEMVFGKQLARAILGLRGQCERAKPTGVTLTSEKPQWFLNDGDTLEAHGIDLVNGKILFKHYCGSGDTAVFHPEQLSEGYCPPENFALLFKKTYWNGSDFSWHLTVVTKNIPKQIGE